ncbi:MAG: hypothetical protein RI996_505 [Candidatus Parcubacteria bacterium]|jgi:uncharacterized protein YqeY
MQEQIKAGIKAAMIAKDSVRLGVLRGLSAAFTNELVTKGKMPSDMLTDDEVMAVIKRESKRRKDSIDQFTAGGRADLADDEKLELAILEEFLPTMMSREEIEIIVKAKLADAGEIDKTKLGQWTGMIIKELAGKADGADVKAVVDTLVG